MKSFPKHRLQTQLSSRFGFLPVLLTFALSLLLTACAGVSVGSSTAPTSNGGGNGGDGNHPGTAYYVSSNGSDSNDGQTPQTPWPTIQYAINQFVLGAHGAVIHVAPGAYSDNSGCMGSAMCVTRGGSSNSVRLTIICDEAWSFNSSTGCLIRTPVFVETSYVDVTGFDIGDLPNNQSGLELVSTSSSSGNGVHFFSNYVHDVGQSVTFNGIEGCINGGMVNGPGHDLPYNVQDFEIVGNFVNHFGTPGNGCNNAHGIYVATGGAIVEDNVVMNVPDMGIEYYPSPCNATIANNTILSNGGGIQITGAGACSTNGNNTIINNIVEMNTGNGIWVGSGSTNCAAGPTLIANNLFNGNGHDLTGVGACETVSGNVNAESPTTTFVDYQSSGSGDYRLQANSPAIAAGTMNCFSPSATCTPVNDLAGVTRAQPLDIGAFAYPGGTVAWPWYW
jgi:Right handed beta helix region